MDGTEERRKEPGLPSLIEADPYPPADTMRPKSSSSHISSERGAIHMDNNISGLTGTVGEPGLPPSRPLSGTISEQSQSQTWQRSSVRGSFTSPPSRRGLPPRGDGSRPVSSVGQTHVPSLTAQGFSRPMSPQLLQAQRGQSITPSVGSRVHSPVPSENIIHEQGPHHSQGFINNIPTSGLSPNSGSTSPTFATAELPEPGSTEFVHGIQSRRDGASLQAEQIQDHRNRNLMSGAPPTPKSSRSLKNTLGLGSRHSSLRNIHGRKPSRSHEKLHSTPQSPITDLDEKPVSTADARRSRKRQGKNYEYFAGNMLFLCSGRFLNTKANPLNVATFILTALPAALFFAFSAPWLWRNISPAIPVVFAYIFLLSISAFLHAAFSDPGILPRNLHPHPPNPDEQRDPLTVGPATTEWVIVKTSPSNHPKPDQLASAENGQAPAGPTTAMEVPTKYCKSCGIWRPPRAHHCRICDACIETQDHHCVWLNNCVGRRNYRFFFSYVGFSSVLALMLLVFSLLHIIYYAQTQGISFGESLAGRTEERMAFAMFIYSILALPYPGSLFVYHLFLVARGETTREYLNSHKFLPKDRHRPFSQSTLLSNWCSVLLRPRPPSYMAFKHPYHEGDARLGFTVRRRDRKQQAKVEAAGREIRVHNLRNRFSVPLAGHDNEEAPQLDSAMEMDRLPIELGKAKKSHPAIPGNINSTPR